MKHCRPEEDHQWQKQGNMGYDILTLCVDLISDVGSHDDSDHANE